MFPNEYSGQRITSHCVDYSLYTQSEMEQRDNSESKMCVGEVTGSTINDIFLLFCTKSWMKKRLHQQRLQNTEVHRERCVCLFSLQLILLLLFPSEKRTACTIFLTRLRWRSPRAGKRGLDGDCVAVRTNLLHGSCRGGWVRAAHMYITGEDCEMTDMAGVILREWLTNTRSAPGCYLLKSSFAHYFILSIRFLEGTRWLITCINYFLIACMC